MKNQANRNIQPVDDHATLSLLNVMRGAIIGHKESMADAHAFEQKMEQCVEELASRMKHVSALKSVEPTCPNETPATTMIREGIESGMSYDGIASALNDAGLTTIKGNHWTYDSVWNRATKMKAGAA